VKLNNEIINVQRTIVKDRKYSRDLKKLSMYNGDGSWQVSFSPQTNCRAMPWHGPTLSPLSDCRVMPWHDPTST
jgi:hypothetical protein